MQTESKLPPKIRVSKSPRGGVGSPYTWPAKCSKGGRILKQVVLNAELQERVGLSSGSDRAAYIAALDLNSDSRLGYERDTSWPRSFGLQVRRAALAFVAAGVYTGQDH